MNYDKCRYKATAEGNGMWYLLYGGSMDELDWRIEICENAFATFAERR